MFSKLSLFARRNVGLLAVAGACVLVGSAYAEGATVDAGLTSIIAGTEATFAAVKIVIISVVVFTLGLKVVKMLRRA